MRDLEQLADDLAQAAHDVRWAQDWRDVGDMLAAFEQRVRDIAAVAKRVAQLATEADEAEDIRTRESAQDCHAELSEVAEALRLLLGVDDA